MGFPWGSTKRKNQENQKPSITVPMVAKCKAASTKEAAEAERKKRIEDAERKNRIVMRSVFWIGIGAIVVAVITLWLSWCYSFPLPLKQVWNSIWTNLIINVIVICVVTWSVDRVIKYRDRMSLIQDIKDTVGELRENIIENKYKDLRSENRFQEFAIETMERITGREQPSVFLNKEEIKEGVERRESFYGIHGAKLQDRIRGNYRDEVNTTVKIVEQSQLTPEQKTMFGDAVERIANIIDPRTEKQVELYVVFETTTYICKAGVREGENSGKIQDEVTFELPVLRSLIGTIIRCRVTAELPRFDGKPTVRDQILDVIQTKRLFENINDIERLLEICNESRTILTLRDSTQEPDHLQKGKMLITCKKWLLSCFRASSRHLHIVMI